MKIALALIIAIALAACAAAKPELPPPPPAADLCAHYNSYRYAPAAAAVEMPDALDKHNANESVFYDKCITNSPKLDPNRQGGPR